MTERKQHFDDDLDLRVSPKLSEDLSALFETKNPIPSEVDRAISDRIHRHFVGIKPLEVKRRRFHWVALWKVAAAAAVVILAFSLDLSKKPEPAAHRRPVLAGVRSTDIDLNGRVDILDAFKLARQIEDAGHIEENLSLQKQEWDINGDGRVDHSDVDMVALAAVRLEKGVL